MNISDISGKPMVMLGGPHVHKQYVKGDIVQEFKWVNGEPVMILYKAVPKTKVGAYMIELKDAHIYARPDGFATRTLIKHAKEAHDAMGFHMDKDAVVRIMDIILDGIPDLVAMPPEPQESEDMNKPVGCGGELTVKLGGEKIIEVAI